MKILKYLLYTVLVIGAVFLLLGLFARHDYHIERTAEIDAPREIVYDQIRFFKNFPNWSPWQQLDPNMKTSIEGTDGTVGAVYKWAGNKNVGTGSQIFKSLSLDRIDMDVVFGDFGASPTSFRLKEENKTTTVTWMMDMHVPFPWNALSMLTDVNTFVGKDFEVGLTNLKKYCERLAPKKYRGYEIADSTVAVTNYTAVRQEVAFQDISKFLGDNFNVAMTEATKAGAKMVGPPSGLYWTYDTIALKTDMAAAIPIDKTVKPGAGVIAVTLGGQRAVSVDYYGDYSKTADAHGAISDYMLEKKLQYVPPVIEQYITDPMKEPDTAKWLTKIIYFVAPKIDSTAVSKK